MKFKIIMLTSLLLIAKVASAQQTGDTSDIVKKTIDDKIDATPAKSNLSYQTLSQFFQTSVTSGTNGGFDFKSSWFGVKKLFGDSSKLQLSQYYSANKFARNFEITLGVHKNSSGDLSTLKGGIKYSPINKRSKSDYNFFQASDLKRDLMARQDVYRETYVAYRKKYIENIPDTATREAANKVFFAALKKFNKSQKNSDLPSDFIKLRDAVILEDKYGAADKFLNLPETDYKEIAKRVDMKSLLTLSFNPGYDYNYKRFDTTSFTVTYLVGFGHNPDKPFNVDLQGQALLLHDTLGSISNLSRQKLVGTAGLNKTLITDSKSNPLIEFETQFEDDYIAAGQLYKNEDRNTVTFNSILTVHLSKTISLPVTLKYDLKKPNLFGIFQLTWNFSSGKSND